MTSWKSFTEETAPDARTIVAKRFGARAVVLLDRILANPVRLECGCVDSGDIVYNDNRPVGFRAAIIRRFYVGREPVLGIVGSTLCLDKSESPMLAAELVKRTLSPRVNASFFMSNTANRANKRLSRMFGIGSNGAEAFATVRYGVISRLSIPVALLRGIMRKMSRKLGCAVCCCSPLRSRWRQFHLNKDQLTFSVCAEIEEDRFSSFWKAVVALNQGLISSRTPKELKWILGDSLNDGSRVMLVAERAGEVVGYVILEYMAGRYEAWKIFDWIAVGNDTNVLRGLIMAAEDFLKTKTWSVRIYAYGFGTAAQLLLRGLLPVEQVKEHNSFVFKSLSQKYDFESLLDDSRSWFLGLCDGDACLL